MFRNFACVARLVRPRGVALRSVTVWSAQDKLKTCSFEGTNRVLRNDTFEKTSVKAALREAPRAERSEALNVATATISNLTRANQFEEALAAFEGSAEKDGTLYGAYFNLCAKALWYSRAMSVWEEIPQEFKTVVSYSTMIDLCRRLKKGNEALALFSEMQASQVQPNIITYNSLINVYSMLDQPDAAVQTFESIKSTLLPAVSPTSQKMAYLAVMSATARAGDYAKTRELFIAMTQDAGLPPEHFHFNALLTSCAHHGYKFSEVAQGVFDTMLQWKLAPRVEDFTILISCLRDDLPRCRAILDEMTRAGVKPVGRTYQELLQAHIIAGDGPGAEALLLEAQGLLNVTSPKVIRLIAQLRALSRQT